MRKVVYSNIMLTGTAHNLYGSEAGFYERYVKRGYKGNEKL